MSKLESLEFRKGVTERKIRLRPENPYFNPIKLIAYDADGNEINSKEVKVYSIQYIKHFKENHITGPYLAVEQKENELLIQNSSDEDWKNVIFVKVKLDIANDFEFDKIILSYQDFNLIENRDSKKDFSTHLEDHKNQKILFSAPFGEGKSTFLKYFFEQNESKYELFKVFPVNYSVASNEDIFRYIKADILFQLMGKDVEFKKEEFSTELASQQYVVSNFGQIAKSLLKAGLCLSNKTEGVVKAINEIEKLIGGFETFKSEVKPDYKSKALKYIKEIYEQEGSLFEDNFYTQLIRELVEQLKSDSEKETVLILDDLDRMDPDHIFRILNVISAHCDTYNIQGEEFYNKFGFDKIIVVCDIGNIRSIFEHRYGKDVDFKGYIDKFYSSGVFEFDSQYVIDQFLDEIENELDRKRSDYTNAIKLFKFFNSIKLLTVRQTIAIIKELNFQSIRKKAYESPSQNYKEEFRQSLFFVVIYLMGKHYHSKEKLIVLLESKKSVDIKYVNLNFCCKNLLSALGVKQSLGVYNYKLNDKNLFYGNIIGDYLNVESSVKLGDTFEEAKKKGDYEFSKEDFYTLLIENIKLL